MATIIRNNAAKVCRSGWNLVSQTWQPAAVHSRGDNASSLSRMFLNSLSISHSRFSTKPPVIGSLFTRGSTIKTADTGAVIPNRCLLQVSSPTILPTRSKIYCSKKKGKQKTVHAVVKRFYRLNWGIWIRTRAGRHKKLWRKSESRKYRLRQHVFCNRQQSRLLDKMTTEYWRKPRYFVDDPYEPYQKRTKFPEYFPEKRPFYP